MKKLKSEFVFKHPDGAIITVDGWETYREARRDWIIGRWNK